MDHLVEVAKSNRKLKQAEQRYFAAMRARNQAIRAARDDRYGPGAIGKAADLTAEQVRRIYNKPDTEVGAATRPRERL